MQWWYSANRGPHSTCQGPVAANTAALTGLTPGLTYIYAAYSDSACSASNFLARAGNFSTATLTASRGADASGATLTIADHGGGAWSYQRTAGPTGGTCANVDAGKSEAALMGLTADRFHGYTAYDGADCAMGKRIAETGFATSDAGAGNIGFADGESRIGGAGGTQWANTFTTANNGAGYELDALSIDFGATGGSPGNLGVAIHTRTGITRPHPPSAR